MEDLLAAFLAALKDEQRSTFTLATYRQNLRTYFHWCADQSVQAPEATSDQLKVYLRRFPNTRTRRLHLAGLRQFYGYLVNDRGLMTADPTRAVDRTGKLVLPLPRIERRSPRVLTDSEQDALFKAVRGDLEARVLLRLMRFSGLRVSEVVGHRRMMYDPYAKAARVFESCGLRICDIDLARLKLDVRGKGRVEDLAYLDRHTAALVDRLVRTLPHQHPEAPIFQLPDGRPKGTRWAFRRFHRLCVDAAVPRHLTLHMLRHTFLTRFLEAGGNLRAAQRLARHRNLDTTLIYADFVQDGTLRAQFDAHNVDTDGKAWEETLFGTQNLAAVAQQTLRAQVLLDQLRPSVREVLPGGGLTHPQERGDFAEGPPGLVEVEHFLLTGRQLINEARG